MDEHDEIAGGSPGEGETGELQVGELQVGELQVGELQVAGPFPAVPDTGLVPTVGAEDVTMREPAAVWESPMPLSMPPFSRPASGLPAGATSEVGGSPPGGLPPAPPWYGGAPGGDEIGTPPPSGQHPGHRMFAAVAVAALLAGGVGAGLGVAFSGSSPTATNVPIISSPAKSTQASTRATESTAAIAKAVEPAIVDIDTDVASPASEGQEEAAGTGMIVTSSGEVVTNNHVVENATKITVSVEGHSGTYAASVIGVDPSKDVALLQIEGFSGSLPTVSLGDSSSVAIGDSVVAIGNALGLGQQPTTVTGTVSALGRTITASDASSTTESETLSNLIETDAQIVPGDSGGPLIDSHGQVIGMDTAALSSADSSTTLGFAIPINEVRTIVRYMEKGESTDGVELGLSPFIGIFEVPSSSSGSTFGGLGGSATSSVAGVGVYDVAIGGPAQAAGIVAGDTITKIDSTSTPTVAALKAALAAEKVGDQVTVTYVDTTGTTHTVSLTLGGIPK